MSLYIMPVLGGQHGYPIDRPGSDEVQTLQEELHHFQAEALVDWCHLISGGFHSHGGTQKWMGNGEIPIENGWWLGVPPFLETPIWTVLDIELGNGMRGRLAVWLAIEHSALPSGCCSDLSGSGTSSLTGQVFWCIECFYILNEFRWMPAVALGLVRGFAKIIVVECLVSGLK